MFSPVNSESDLRSLLSGTKNTSLESSFTRCPNYFNWLQLIWRNSYSNFVNCHLFVVGGNECPTAPWSYLVKGRFLMIGSWDARQTMIQQPFKNVVNKWVLCWGMTLKLFLHTFLCNFLQPRNFTCHMRITTCPKQHLPWLLDQKTKTPLRDYNTSASLLGHTWGNNLVSDLGLGLYLSGPAGHRSLELHRPTLP